MLGLWTRMVVLRTCSLRKSHGGVFSAEGVAMRSTRKASAPQCEPDLDDNDLLDC